MGLLAAFPLAFAIIMPAVYFPILVMLLALVFRGVAFEFRYRDSPRRTFWDHAFCYGSGLATFAQGIVLGAFIQGFQTAGRQFSGGSFDCFTLFSLVTGIALLFGYGLLGAGWLVLKTEGDLQDWARRLGRWCLLGVVVAWQRVKRSGPCEMAEGVARIERQGLLNRCEQTLPIILIAIDVAEHEMQPRVARRHGDRALQQLHGQDVLAALIG